MLVPLILASTVRLQSEIVLIQFVKCNILYKIFLHLGELLITLWFMFVSRNELMLHVR